MSPGENSPKIVFIFTDDPGRRINLFSSNPELAGDLISEMKEDQKALGPLPPSLNIGREQDNSHYEYLANRQKVKLD